LYVAEQNKSALGVIINLWRAPYANSALRATANSRCQEKTMNKDQVKGRIHEAKGKVKEVAGKVVGNKELEVKGKAEKAAGKVQGKFGDLKSDVKKSI
jgi:uncharacterized protein YjbJ (UPF0337 family)